MKVAPMIIIFWLFAFMISLFQATSLEDYGTSDYFGENSTSSDGLMEIFLHPDMFDVTTITGLLFTLGAIGGIVTTAVGLYAKSDMVVLLGWAVLLIAVVVRPIQEISSWMMDLLSSSMCSASLVTNPDAWCSPAVMVTAIVMGSVVIMYIMAVLEWWTSRSLTK